jgi:ketosteroid isomerase-like protein
VATNKASDSILDELLAVERAGWRSLCDQTGDDFYGQIMTDDAVMVLANGQVMTREDVIGALGQAPPWASFDLRDARVVESGSDAAALVYVGSATRDEGGEPFVATMSSVYRREGDEWRLVLYQQTPAATG